LTRFERLPYRLLLFFAIGVAAVSFYQRSGGHLIWSDDHPTFMYRLWLLDRHFPTVLFYNPLWNAGLYAGDLIATGSLNVFFLFWPLLKLFGPFTVYNTLVVLLLFVLSPAAVYLAARVIEQRSPVAAVAALLSLTGSLYWYVWSLKYGTMGFMVTALLVPLNIAIASRLVCSRRELLAWQGVVFVCTLSLMLFWTPSSFVFLPLAVCALLRIRHVLRKRFFLPIVAALLVLNVPWMTMLVRSTNVLGFVSQGVFDTERSTEVNRHAEFVPAHDDGETASAGEASHFLEAGMKTFQEKAASTNPLVLVFGPLGLVLLRRGSRLGFSLTAVWLLVMGAVLAPLKPQFELSRMLVILAQLLTIPAAVLLVRLFDSVRERLALGRLRHPLATVTERMRDRLNLFASCSATALCGGFLLTGPFVTGSIVWNRAHHQFYFADPTAEHLVDAIREHGGRGRVLFSGFILHELSGGHIAPLAALTGIPMIARSQVHNNWWRRDVIPQSFIDEGFDGIEHYMDLMNVELIVAHERPWRKFFAEHPERYTELWRSGSFVLFRRLAPLSYFLEGSGTVLRQTSDSVELRLDTPDAVVKFHWVEQIESSACTLEPVSAGEDLTLVRLRGCPLKTLILLHGERAPWMGF
ncbi:MAG: hypothetical protein KDD44_00355, partial [Bdellovibrionales bacterium]|nr:hypothetical protein [Bdellovibrionales bacterium]